MVGGGRPLRPEILGQSDTPRSKTATSNRYSPVLWQNEMTVCKYVNGRKCSPNNLVFSDISLMAIFAEVTDLNERNIDRHLSKTTDTIFIFSRVITYHRLFVERVETVDIDSDLDLSRFVCLNYIWHTTADILYHFLASKLDSHINVWFTTQNDLMTIKTATRGSCNLLAIYIHFSIMMTRLKVSLWSLFDWNTPISTIRR